LVAVAAAVYEEANDVEVGAGGCAGWVGAESVEFAG
jgi:hypothetical protein